MNHCKICGNNIPDEAEDCHQAGFGEDCHQAGFGEGCMKTMVNMPNSQTKLKKVEEAASGVYDYESAFDTITQDRQLIERVLVEKLEGKKVANEHNSECLHNDAPEYCDCDNYIKWNQALDQAITLVKEVLQGK